MILLTGAAGYLGSHIFHEFKKRKIKLIGIDNFNNYYDTALKYKRCDNLLSLGIEIEDVDLKDKQHIESILRFQNNTSIFWSHVVKICDEKDG